MGSWQEQVALACGTFLQAACANSFNQVFETNRDSIMTRTKNRPLPTRRISKTHAIIQAIVAGSAGTALLLKYTNPLTASLGFANIFIYAGVYTPLKTRHWLNTWVGTINGSLPPLMGCTAASNTIVHPAGFYMFTSMYLWQISHFMAICYKCRSDYNKAGYQMLSIEDPQAAATQSVLHAGLIFPLCWAMGPWGLNATPWWFPVITTPINYWYLLKPSIKFHRQVNYQNATDLFFASLKHLGLLFVISMYAFWSHEPSIQSSQLPENSDSKSVWTHLYDVMVSWFR
jgi:protoheme IX farnesyltransferase